MDSRAVIWLGVGGNGLEVCLALHKNTSITNIRELGWLREVTEATLSLPQSHLHRFPLHGGQAGLELPDPTQHG